MLHSPSVNCPGLYEESACDSGRHFHLHHCDNPLVINPYHHITSYRHTQAAPVPAEGTQEAAYNPAAAHQTQEASAAAGNPEEARIPVGETPEAHHSQPAKEAGVAVNPTVEEAAEHSAVAEAKEQNYSRHSDDRRIQEEAHPVAGHPFVVARRAWLLGQMACRRS